MSKKEISKTYEPKKVEDSVYAAWEKSGAFKPESLSGEPFSLMMPPPNVTGVLHLGHALENTLMDMMIRYQRMQEKKTLLLPGVDHAAVATQARVEKNLMKEGFENPREHFGREKLLEKVRAYAEESKATILKQIRKMGTSADWSRLAYTFDDARNRAVNEIFTRMYNDGLIYRGHRVVNWSVKGQSTCSDDELVYMDRQAKFYTFKYSKDFPITIATTRPETKLGDTAVAVNPKDKRYKKFIGKTFDVVFCGQPLKIKVIADDHVDAKFGTGALGVTPAHSQIDFEMYETQKAAGDEIDLIQVIGQDGKMTNRAGAFAGLTTLEAREKIVAQLEKEGLLEKEEDIEQSVGTSDRFGDVVEAIPMTQWFVAVNKEIPGRGKTLKELMKEAVEVGHKGDKNQKIRITPKRFEKSYYGWIDNLRDWCISRQIWFGHQIPVWYKGDEVAVGEAPKGSGWEQDPDTLDTWFSSGTWTFSTLGWPEETEDLKTFHPTTWMQMGYEILFFWMARMILMSTYVLDEIPFKEVYIHGILRDKSGQKFSKSLGNGIDPLEVIEKYGADALRFSLIAGISPGNDARFYEEKVESASHLVNKLWNISRFAMMKVEDVHVVESVQPKTLAEKWILGRFSQFIKEITKHYEKYEFSQAAEKLREFTWSEFADVAIEVSKRVDRKDSIGDEALLYVLERLLKLWHPLIPFVTEELYKAFDAGQLIVAEWPKAEHKIDNKSAKVFEFSQDAVSFYRDAHARYKIAPTTELPIGITDTEQAIANASAAIITGLTGTSKVELHVLPRPSAMRVFTSGTVQIGLEGHIDIPKERARLKKELDETVKYMTALEMRLAGEFAKKAPKEVVESEEANLATAKEKVEKLKEELASLS